MKPQPVALNPFILPVRLAADKAVTGTAKVIYAVIAATRGLDGLCTEPLAAICTATGTADSNVRQALRQLVDAGWLTPLQRPSKPTAWAVTEPSPPESGAPKSGGKGSLPPESGGTRLIPSTPPSRLNQAGITEKAEEIWPSWEAIPPDSGDPHARASSLPSLPSEEILTGEIVAVGKGVRGKPDARPRRMPVPCPEDYTPSPRTLAMVTGKRPDVDASYELAKFTRYFTEGKGSRDRRSEWDASFIRWMERADPTPASVAAAPSGARAADAAARLSPSSRRLLEIIEEEERRHG